MSTFTHLVHQLGNWPYLAAIGVALTIFFGGALSHDRHVKKHGTGAANGSTAVGALLVISGMAFVFLSLAWGACQLLAGPTAEEVQRMQTVQEDSARSWSEMRMERAASVKELQGASDCIKAELARGVNHGGLITKNDLRSARIDCEKSLPPKERSLVDAQWAAVSSK